MTVWYKNRDRAVAAYYQSLVI